MFKRLRWTLLGALAGVGGSMWARRRVRRSVERYLPEQLGNQARQWFSDAGYDLRQALDEGRMAMAEREAELHNRFAQHLIAPPVRRGRVIDAEPRTPSFGDPPFGCPQPLLPDSRPATARALDRPVTTQREPEGYRYRRQRRRR